MIKSATNRLIKYFIHVFFKHFSVALMFKLRPESKCPSERLCFLIEHTLIIYVQVIRGFKKMTSCLQEKTFENNLKHFVSDSIFKCLNFDYSANKVWFAQTWKVLEFYLGPGKLLEFVKSASCPGLVLEFCKIFLENMNLSLKWVLSDLWHAQKNSENWKKNTWMKIPWYTSKRDVRLVFFSIQFV